MTFAIRVDCDDVARFPIALAREDGTMAFLLDFETARTTCIHDIHTIATVLDECECSLGRLWNS